MSAGNVVPGMLLRLTTVSWPYSRRVSTCWRILSGRQVLVRVSTPMD